MKILFVSEGQMPDYQCDMLIHGLKHLLGADAIDVNRAWYMYKSEFENASKAKRDLYGRGFTVFGLLGDDSGVDRQDIESKIRHCYFDFVIYGSIRRSQIYLDHVLSHYSSNQITFIDGEDDNSLAVALLGRGIYFKRELVHENRYVMPIQFAIPEEKIGTILQTKRKNTTYIDPRNRDTYIYDNEEEYYNDYAQSLFGFTQKKAEWDCFRHYEIMANGCIPLFENLESCPYLTMVFLPKYELISAKFMLASHGESYFNTAEGRHAWEQVQNRIDRLLKRNLTTVALARYVLGTLQSGRLEMPMLNVGDGPGSGSNLVYQPELFIVFWNRHPFRIKQSMIAINAPIWPQLLVSGG